MTCENCNTQQHYGAKYCNVCGEKIEVESYEAEYKKTIWGKFDRVEDAYHTLLLHKVTGHILFKVLILVIILLLGVFGLYLKYSDIRLLASEQYAIEYNKAAEEYYIRTDLEEVVLSLYIPKAVDTVCLSTSQNGELTPVSELSIADYAQEGLVVKKGAQDYLIVEAKRGDKVADSVKVVVTEP